MSKLSPFQKKKINAYFNQLVNSVTPKGKDLDFGKFMEHGFNIQKSQGWAEEDKTFIDLIAAKTMFWTVFHSRMGGKGIKSGLKNLWKARITAKGWLDFWDELQTDVVRGLRPAWVSQIMVAIFNNLDLDSSGTIEKKEYDIYLKSIGVKLTAAKLNAVWKKLTKGQPKPASGQDPTIPFEKMEELLQTWLLNDNAKDKLPGDSFPLGQ